MSSFFEKIRKIFLNKNTVTILAVVAGVIVLWVVYSITLDKAVKPQRVPVATKDLTAGTIITKDDIEYVEVNSDVLKKASVITNSSQLIGYYVTNNTSIVRGSMFYKSEVVTKDKLIERDLETIPKGYRLYWLKVDNTTTYANSIYPGDKIDLWLKTKFEGKYVYEEFITNIEVLSVKDSKGQNVFDVTSGRTPAWLLFAVKTDMYRYLKLTENISGMSLVPVPKNNLVNPDVGSTEYSSQELIDLLDRESMRMGA